MFYVEKQKEKQFLLKAKIGIKEGKKIALNDIEAIYLNEFRNFNFPASFSSIKIKDYLAYRDLRIKNLYPVFYEIKAKLKSEKLYKGKPLKLPPKKLKVKEEKEGFVLLERDDRELYEKHWFGQLGVYKSKTGKFHFLDMFEALYLKNKGILKLKNYKKFLKKYSDHFEVYSFWRDNGFVLKTGFKFGTDFRIYFPLTSPTNFEHSKHVLHVFPKGFNMRVEELSRAIRVANSVKKTFILAVPKEEKISKPSFYLLSRDKKPLYMVKTFNQEEKISSKSLSYLLNKANENGVKLLIAIVDRETSLTYYEITKIKLRGNSNFGFYEVRWINP